MIFLKLFGGWSSDKMFQALYAVKTNNVDQINDSFIGCSGKNFIRPENFITQNQKEYVLVERKKKSGKNNGVVENCGGINWGSSNDSSFRDVKGTIVDTA